MAAAATAAVELQPPNAAAAEEAGMARVRRKKDFRHMERVDGRMVNVLQGLELHTAVFSPDEQRKIVACVLDLQDKGRRGLLRERTYSEPKKWMRGKGRATIQFGCCYNYATDRNGNPPGIIRDEEVDPLPPMLASMVRRLVHWRVLPPTCVPDSCIVNIYDKDDCIPPHIDHHDFLRPFCTVSFLAECSILFGVGIKALGPGEFQGPASIPLPVGSVLVLSGNGADVAKHCVPAVPAKRISITFRKMDSSKLPVGFRPHPELQNLAVAPLTMAQPVRPAPQAQPPQNRAAGEQKAQASSSAAARTAAPQQPAAPAPSGRTPAAATPQQQQQAARQSASGGRFVLSADEFPALGAAPAAGRLGSRR